MASRSSLTRRRFIRATGATLAAAGLAPAVSAPYVARAGAYPELKIIQWRHFVPEYDAWFDALARDWGAKNGVDVTVDHVPHLELPARAAAEAAAGAGHDIFAFGGSGGPHRYASQVLDLTALVESVEKKYGKVEPIGRQIAYDAASKSWSAFPDYYACYPGLYRKDLWDDIGMTPDTWEEVRVGGAKLKAKGHPIGIGLGHSVDPNVTWRGVLWSFGASVQDETGRRVVLQSAQAVEAVKFACALYQEAMEPDVLTWDDASNNQLLASGRGAWISNPISAYRAIQKSNQELADSIALWKTPAGPVRRLVAGAPSAYVVWRFARNQEAAVAFLRYYADHWLDAFQASTGYNSPLFAGIVPSPAPILSFDDTSDPPDKLSVLETANDWHAADGYPGPAGPACDEVAGDYVICDMMAHAATGRMTPEQAVAWASREIAIIYKKWQG